MARFALNIHVGEDVRNFLIATQGSDIFIPSKTSILWGIVKQHLVLYSHAQHDLDPPPQESITMLMLEKQSMKCYSVQLARELCVNTLYRSYLDERGQRAVRDFFEKNIKQLFIFFMEGVELSGGVVSTANAIREFCLRYGIDYNDKIYAKYRKCWYRHQQKKLEESVCPIIF